MAESIMARYKIIKNQGSASSMRQTVQFTWETGSKIPTMAQESTYIQTDKDIKGSFNKDKELEMEKYIIPMGIFTKENG